MAIAWSRISSKVIAYPPSADAACKRRCGNLPGLSGAFIPQMVDRRKQEVLEARDAAVTPLAQTRGRRCHVRLGRLHPAEILTEHRSTTCPHANETPKNRPKPDTAVACKRRSVWSVIGARRSMLRRSARG